MVDSYCTAKQQTQSNPVTFPVKFDDLILREFLENLLMQQSAEEL